MKEKLEPVLTRVIEAIVISLKKDQGAKIAKTAKGIADFSRGSDSEEDDPNILNIPIVDEQCDALHCLGLLYKNCMSSTEISSTLEIMV